MLHIVLQLLTRVPYFVSPRRLMMRPVAITLVICALAVLLAPAARGGSEEPPLAPTVVAVDVAAARDLVRSGGHRYLDVRTEEEFREGHVEGAINVPYVFYTSSAGTEKNPKFVEMVTAQFDKQDNIVVGCKLGVRSVLACVDLMETGFKNVKNMKGGVTKWVENGFAVKKCELQDEL